MALFDNLIIKEIWEDIIPAKFPTESKLLSSGVVLQDTTSKFSGGGIYSRTPFVYEPTSDLERPVVSTALTPVTLTMAEDKMICLNRQIDFKISKKELRRLGIISDNDQATNQGLENLLSIKSKFLAKQMDKYFYLILKGAFAGTLTATHQLSNGAKITMSDIFEAKALLGDNGYTLTDLFMHSKVKEDARQAGLIDYKLSNWGAEIAQTGTIDQIAGLKITESDLVNKTAVPVYSSYAFAKNSLYFAMPYLSVDTNYYSNIGGGEFHSVLNVDFVVHIPGVAYNISNVDPTNAQLEAAGTWNKIADHNADIKVIEILNI